MFSLEGKLGHGTVGTGGGTMAIIDSYDKSAKGSSRNNYINIMLLKPIIMRYKY
jgi:hypothetical protein